MAKKSKIVKNERRRAIVARYAQRRAELKEIIRSPSSTGEQRAAAQSELARQPRDASAVRLRNRDSVDGRPRGYLRKFGLSRMRVRQLAHNGQLPGVRKDSWGWPRNLETLGGVVVPSNPPSGQRRTFAPAWGSARSTTRTPPRCACSFLNAA